MSIPGSSGGFDFKSTDRMANLKNALFLVAFCSLCSGMPTDEGGQEVSRFMLVDRLSQMTLDSPQIE